MSSDATPRLPEPLRTVSTAVGNRPDAEMHGIGLLVFALLLVLVVPLLPFVAVLWVVSRIVDAVGGSRRTGREGGRGRRPAA